MSADGTTCFTVYVLRETEKAFLVEICNELFADDGTPRPGPKHGEQHWIPKGHVKRTRAYDAATQVFVPCKPSDCVGTGDSVLMDMTLWIAIQKGLMFARPS